MKRFALCEVISYQYNCSVLSSPTSNSFISTDGPTLNPKPAPYLAALALVIYGWLHQLTACVE